MWKTNLKVLVTAVIVVGFYTMVAHAIPQLESEVPEALSLGAGATPEALVAAGEQLYAGAGGCTACHGTGTRAPNIITDHAGQGAIGARCATREAGKDCKTYLYESMTTPGTYVVPGFDNIMPDVRRQLGEDQIWALVAYLQSLGGEVTVTAADLPAAAAGAPSGAGAAPPTGAGPPLTSTMEPVQLLTEKGCMGCHQLAGTGAPIGPTFDGMGARLSPELIRRGILVPNADTARGYEQFAGMMPATFGQQLSAAQLEAMVQFLAGLK
ncbi:MAG: cytochrome c [Gemmatimonadota bacterium]|nr:cytochrome c [Gemmatimonadota bacterium]